MRVIGVGREDRGDDVAGWAVVDRLTRDVEAVKHNGEPVGLLELITGADDVAVVDAMTSGRPAGTVVEFDALAGPLPAAACRTSHGVGVAEVIELARAFGELPRRLRVFGIEGHRFGTGEPPSAEVFDGVEEVTRRILAN